MPQRKWKMNSKKVSSIFRRIFAIWFYSFFVKCLVTNVPALGKSFSNEAIKSLQLSDHLEKKHADKKDKPVAFFQDLKDKFRKKYNNKYDDKLLETS